MSVYRLVAQAIIVVTATLAYNLAAARGGWPALDPFVVVCLWTVGDALIAYVRLEIDDKGLPADLTTGQQVAAVVIGVLLTAARWGARVGVLYLLAG